MKNNVGLGGGDLGVAPDSDVHLFVGNVSGAVGADGSFTLYEDESDNYNYESGSYATIPFMWNEVAQTLTIGARQGSFPGMLANRTFRIVWVSTGHGTGIPNTVTADSVVNYTGAQVDVSPIP